MVVWLDTFAVLALVVCEDGLALGTDDLRESFCCLESCVDPIDSDWVIAVTNEDGNTATSNSWLWYVISGHAKVCLLAGVGAALLGWRGCSCLLGYGLGELDVDVAKTLDDAVVYDWVVAVVELET